MYSHVPCKIIYNSQDVGATQVTIDRLVDKSGGTYTQTEYYLAIQKNEILPSATAWMDLSEIYQRKANTIWFYLPVKSKTQNRNQLIDTENKLMVARWAGGIGEKVKGIKVRKLPWPRSSVD